VTWTATDKSGKSSTCSLKVAITDDESPTLASGCGDETGTTDAGKPYGTVGAGSHSRFLSPRSTTTAARR